MGEFFVYMIKAAICLTAFYLLFKLLMGRDTHHSANRFALIGILVLSLALPTIHADTAGQTAMTATMQGIETLIIESVAADRAEARGISAAQTLFLIYIIGVAGFSVREVLSLISLHRIVRKGSRETTEDGLRLTITDGDVSPFSWFGNIIISRKDFDSHRREILMHEREHARRHHSADILLCDMMIIFQWFSPSAWLLKRELQAVHEYEADNAVLRSGISASDYQLLLIRKAVGEQLYSMVNNLNQSSIKKRITMMMTKKSSKWSSLKLLAMLPVAAVAVAAFANEKVESISEEIKEQSNSLVSEVAQKAEKASAGSLRAMGISTSGGAQQTETSSTAGEPDVNNGENGSTLPRETATDGGDKDLPKADVLPKFPGGETEMFVFIGQNLHYPKAAADADEHGKVRVKFTVEKDGSITSPEVETGVSPTLDAEAIRLVKSMPRWEPALKDNKPVRAIVTLPIVFRMRDKNTVTSDGNSSKVNTGIRASIVTSGAKSKSDPIYLVNGKEVTKKELESIRSDKVKDMTVMNGGKAIEKYGERANGGVVEITLK